MSINSVAELIWGIPILAYDEDGKPTEFWDEEGEDWRNLEGELEVVGYGHYADDDMRGILTSARVEALSADCWTPQNVEPGSLATSAKNDKAYSKANDAARAQGLDVNFYSQASWWLVASVG